MFGRLRISPILVLLVSSALNHQGTAAFAHPPDGIAAAAEEMSGGDSLAAAMGRGDADRVERVWAEGSSRPSSNAALWS